MPDELEDELELEEDDEFELDELLDELLLDELELPELELDVELLPPHADSTTASRAIPESRRQLAVNNAAGVFIDPPEWNTA